LRCVERSGLFVPYGETCARFARVLSGDLEGHAPSWPWGGAAALGGPRSVVARRVMEGRAPSWPRLALVIGRPSTEAQRTRRSASLHQHRSLAAEGRFRLLNRNRFAGGRGESCALAQRAAVGKQRRDESGNRIAVPGKR